MTAPVALDAAILTPEEFRKRIEYWLGERDRPFGPRTNPHTAPILDHDAALRLALETATRERDEARSLAFVAAAEGERLTERLAAEAGALAMVEEIFVLDGIETPSSDGSENAATAVHDALESLRAERDAALARLEEAAALLLDVWDSHHREGWEATETAQSVIDRLGDWRWNNGYDPHNPPLRPDPRQKGAPRE